MNLIVRAVLPLMYFCALASLAYADSNTDACRTGNAFKERDAVISACQTALQSDDMPDQVRAALLAQLGEAQYWKNEHSDAAQTLQAALDLDPSLNETRIQLGWARYVTGDENSALNLFNQAETVNPKSARTVFALGFIASRHGDPDKAISYFHEALKRDPDSIFAHNSLAAVYWNSFGDPDRASAEFDAVLALGRKKVDEFRYVSSYRISNDSDTFDNIRFKKGVMLYQLQHIDQGAPILEELKLTYPKSPELLWQLTSLKFLRGDADAVAFALASRASVPDCFCSMSDVMAAQYAKGEYEEALATGHKIFSYSGSQNVSSSIIGHSAFLMSQLEKRKGENETAFDYLELASKSGGNGPQYVLTALLMQGFYEGTAQDQINHQNIDSALHACIADKDCLISDSGTFLGFYGGQHAVMFVPEPLPDVLLNDQAALSKACLADFSHLLPANAVPACEKLAEDANTAPSDRSHIYLRLALAMENPQIRSTKTGDVWDSTTGKYYDEAMKADPKNVDVYFLEAWRAYQNHPDSTAPTLILAKGLEAIPNAPRLLAEQAQMEAQLRGVRGTQDLCAKALDAAPDDIGVITRCAAAYYDNEMFGDALPLLEKQAETYDGNTMVLDGIDLGRNPSMMTGRIYAMSGQPDKAAAAMDAYIAKVPAGRKVPFGGVFLDEWLADGKYHEDAKQFKEAAKAYQAAVALANADQKREIQVKLVVALAQSGDIEQTHDLAKSLFSGGNQKLTLWLQLRLVNAGDASLPISGNYDDATQQSIERCIINKGCRAG